MEADKIVVINLPERTDRRADITKQLEAIGWSEGAVFHKAGRPPDAGGFPSIGARGCFLSHLAALKDAVGQGIDSLIVLEDDASFVPAFRAIWPGFRESLRETNWAMAYPGHSSEGLVEGFAPVPLAFGIRSAHFYMVNGKALPAIITGLEQILGRPPGHPDGGPMHLDGAYWTIRQQQQFAVYASCPPLAFQRSSRSDISPGVFDRLIPESMGLLRRLRNRASEADA